MKTPNFQSKEFVSASNVNAAFDTISGNLANLGALSRAPGLIHPEIATLVTGAGLAVTGTFTYPFGVIFGTGGSNVSGTLVHAHGTNTNADTQTYICDFTSIVPASGVPITAYIAASYQSIQQAPYVVTGPPPGHPDYNPNYVPVTAYQTQVDSLAITATSAIPDGQTLFEIARTTLVTGATGVTVTTEFQARAGTYNVSPLIITNGVLTPAQAGNLIYINGATQLPPSQSCQGLVFTITNSSTGTAQILSTAGGGDLIFGAGPNPASGLASATIYPATSLSLEAGQIGWTLLIGGGRNTASLYSAIITPSGTAAYPWLAAVSGAITPGNLAVFADVSGTVKDSGFGPNGQVFISTDQSWLAGATVVVAHGLGGVPQYFQYSARCKVAEQGYHVGDVIQNISASTMTANSSNLYLVVGAAGLVAVKQDGSGLDFSLTPANWALVMSATLLLL